MPFILFKYIASIHTTYFDYLQTSETKIIFYLQTSEATIIFLHIQISEIVIIFCIKNN